MFKIKGIIILKKVISNNPKKDIYNIRIASNCSNGENIYLFIQS